MNFPVIPVLGISAAIGWATSIATQVATPEIPIQVVPVVNLAAVVAGAVSMGMLFNRVKELERRVNRLEDSSEHKS